MAEKNATFDLFFLGLGWPWVGEFVGFILIPICFSTQHNLVNRKHLITTKRVGFSYFPLCMNLDLCRSLTSVVL